MTTGLFGKLPCYGDFLCRDLDTNFVDLWDGWLQGFVAGTQEQLGDTWLDIYLTSPIWRFAFSSGVVDENTWVGILLPSVDRVGRYFPFSLAKNIGSLAPPVALSDAANWFDEVEEVALQALEGETSVEDILAMANEVAFPLGESYSDYTSPESLMGTVVNMEFDSQNIHSVYSRLLHHALVQNSQSYSLWHTRGSQYVEPCAFYCRALPQVNGAAAMLDGNWEASNWAQPFPLLIQPQPELETESEAEIVAADQRGTEESNEQGGPNA